MLSRPFLWKGEIYVSHGLSFEQMSDRQAISKLDFKSKQLKFVYYFDAQPILKNGFSEAHWREKNWGFAPGQGELIIFYSFFPCTTTFTYAPADASGMAIMKGTCYDGESVKSSKSAANIIWTLTGLDIRKVHHNSGHPILWSSPSGDRQSYLAIVHVKEQVKTDTGSENRYYHWALRVSKQNFRVTHISRGPIVNTSQYLAEGFINVMTIGSFHLLPRLPGQLSQYLLLFMGEGDKFSCTYRLRLEDIRWIKVPPALYRRIKFKV